MKRSLSHLLNVARILLFTVVGHGLVQWVEGVAYGLGRQPHLQTWDGEHFAALRLQSAVEWVVAPVIGALLVAPRSVRGLAAGVGFLYGAAGALITWTVFDAELYGALRDLAIVGVRGLWALCIGMVLWRYGSRSQTTSPGAMVPPVGVARDACDTEER